MKTGIHITDNVGNPDPVTADIPCSVVRVRELAATTNYYVRAPAAADAQYLRLSGEESAFPAPPGSLFQTGDIAGYTETVAGSITMGKLCEP